MQIPLGKSAGKAKKRNGQRDGHRGKATAEEEVNTGMWGGRRVFATPFLLLHFLLLTSSQFSTKNLAEIFSLNKLISLSISVSPKFSKIP
jgi:hypothetical protein